MGQDIDVTSETINRNIGEQVKLKVQLDNPNGREISSLHWTIAGDPIKNYAPTVEGGVPVVIPLTEDDLNSTPSITFYWIHASMTCVTVDVTLSDPKFSFGSHLRKRRYFRSICYPNAI